MQKQTEGKIMIPEGCFEGYCNGCFYAKKKDVDAKGRVFCKGEPGGYHFLNEKNECRYYLSKIMQWIKIIAFLWLAAAGLELLIMMFAH